MVAGNPERLESRQMLAFDLVAAYAQSTVPFFVAGTTNTAVVLNESPGQITLTFSPGTQIDTGTLSSISVTRSGRGGDQFGPGGGFADVTVVPGSIAVDDLPNQNQVILRFADTLPDDTYRITIGDQLTGNSGANPFRPAQGATSQSIDLRLDLGAQVVSVVPQPVIRDKTIDVTAMPVDGDLLTVSVRGKSLTIEFDDNDTLTRSGATRLDIRAGQNDTLAKVATAIQSILAPAGSPATAFGGELASAAVAATKVSVAGTTFTPVVSLTDKNGGASTRLVIGDGSLVQKRDTLVVYFNANDPLQSASAQNPANYQVFETDAATAANLAVLTPTGVVYDPVSGTAVLSFAEGAIGDGKVYRLQVGGGTDTNSKLDKAVNVGSIFQQPVPATPAFTTTAFLGESSVNDVDLYKINLTAAGIITVKASPAAGFNPLLRLFDATGVAITAGVVAANNGAGVADTLTYTAAAGDYFVGVSSTGNAAYSAIDGTGATGGATTGSYKLEISSTAPVAAGDDNSSFGTATGLGTLGVAGATVSAAINVRSSVPTPAGNLLFPVPPGAVTEPGHRDTPADSGSHGAGGEAVVPAAPIPVREYNFQADYGVDPQGNPLTNLITEDQKQRAREVFELFSRVSGIRFVETPASGLTVVTGDMRALNPGTPTDPNGVIGLGGPGMVVMNSRVDWGSSDEYGGRWFETAMHEIGHAIGLDHAYDLPAIMGYGLAGEKVYPGDYDSLHLLQIYPKTGSDVDVYSFTLPAAGTFTAETVVARAGSAAQSAVDTVITLYRQDPVTGTRELVARNDDYYGRDSFLALDLQAGTYFVAVTSTGNDRFNPDVENSGNGGRTDGAYDLTLGFTPTAAADTTIVDAASSVPLDGDRDGVPGGAFNFWFDTAADKATVFVDKAAPALASTSTWLAGDTQLTLASVAGLAAGMKVSAAGVPAGTLIGTVNGGTKVITLVDALGAPVAATVAGTASTVTCGGTLANPFRTLSAAVAAAATGGIIRAVGNGGNAADAKDDLPYQVGKSSAGVALEDGLRVNVPKGVTLMIDESAVFKMGESVIDVGSSSPLVDRKAAALQVLGTPSGRVVFTSIHDDTVGKDVDGVGPAAAGGQWGGLVLRQDSDSATRKIFVNSVTNADLRYGGGSVLIDSQLQSITPLHLVSTRPTLAFNTITDSSGAGISADPNSFEDTGDRVGPALRGNLFVETRNDGPGGAPLLHQNSINGMFVRINTAAGSSIDTLSVPARFTSSDMVYVITENLLVEGGAGGYVELGGVMQARPTGRLAIDPGVVVKLQGARIELGRGNAQLIAEGEPGNPVVFTSFGDNRYGAGGTFDTNGILPDSRTPGDWGGLMINAGSKASIDRAYLGFAGGQTPIEGGYSTFDAIEVHQGDLRLANSRIEFNAATTAPNDRTGRGTNTPATIFVRGSQPVIVGNDFRDNAGAVISINANALTESVVADPGRSTGTISRFADYDANQGPLVRSNRLTYAAGKNATVGMVVRAEEITTETVWDDTDIVHVPTGEIIVQNFHTATGIRLQSAATSSLVVKLSGANAGITAAGYGLDIDDRIGGTVQVVGAPGYPVVMTSLADDTVGASLDASGVPVKDTNNDGASYGATGQWRGLKFLPLSNDRNVEVVNEAEVAVSKLIDVNAVVGTAQVLGTLGPNYATQSTETPATNSWDSSQEKGGDDNRRLGFEVHGSIAIDNPRDVDVYSFTGYAGSEVWLDLDKTAPALDAMLELLDADGNVLARNDDAQTVTSTSNATVYGTDVAGQPLRQQFHFAPGVMPATLSGTIYLQGGSTQTFTANAAGVLSFANANGVPTNAVVAANSNFNASTGVLTLEFTAAPGTGAAHVVVSYSSSALSPTTIAGALPLEKDPFKGGDAYSVNPRDPGMRVVLPGVTGQAVQYYVRVRSQPKQDTATLAGYGGGAAGYEASLRSTTFDQAGDKAAGATSGTYELRIRLRQQDEKPGSTVRYADIRFPVVGIDVLGLPAHSPLLGETGESTAANDTPATAQEIGNLLTTDRNTISVAGALTTAADVDWYTFELNYEQIQAIGGVNAGGKTWSTVFDLNYGDGFKGDYTLSVFDSAYRLIYVGRDSNVADDQPGAGQGSDTDDLSRGSFGKLDPFIGPAQLNAGTPTAGGRQTNDGSSAIPASPSTFRYYVAVSSTERLPPALDATFRATPTSPLARLEPVNSVRRIVEDHIGFTGYKDSAGTNIAPTTPAIFDTTTGTATFTASVTTGSNVIYIAPANGSTAGLKPGMSVEGGFPGGTVIRSIDGPQLLTVSRAASFSTTAVTFSDNRLNQNVRQFTLADVTLFGASGTGLFTVDASTGTFETSIGTNVSSSQVIGDLDMRPDGRLYAYTNITNDTANVGRLIEFDSGTGGQVATSTDGIANKAATGATNFQTSTDTVLATAFRRTDVGKYDELWLVIDDGTGNGSKLYRAAAGGTAAGANGGANAQSNQGYTDKVYGYRGNIRINGGDTVVTGLQFAQDSGGTLYGVTKDGKLVTITAAAKPAANDTPITEAVATVVADFKADLTAAGAGTGFTGLAAAPQNLSDGLYRGKFFAVTDTGRLVLLDPTATQAAVLFTAGAATNTQTRVVLPIGNPAAVGVAASSLVFAAGFAVGTTVASTATVAFSDTTVTDAGDTITTATAHGLSDGDQIRFTATDFNVLSGITVGTTYYVRNSTATTFQISATLAGAIINLTTTSTPAVVNGRADFVGPSALTMSAAATSAETYAANNPLNVVASTAQFSGTLTNGSTNVTVTGAVNVTSLAKVTAGTLVFGAGIPANTTVVSRTDASLTLSANATTAGAQTLTFLTPTVARSAVTTNTVTTVTLAKTSDLRIGMLVFGSGVVHNTRITAINAATGVVTLSQAVTTTSTANTLSFVNTSSLGYVAEWSTTTNTLPLSGTPTSIAFSPLDVNLWHPTDLRGTAAAADEGHGVPYTSDNSRLGAHYTEMDIFGRQANNFFQDVGGASMAFSLEGYNTTPRASNVYYVAPGGNGQFGVVSGASYNWQQELTANPNIGDNYNLPGGAYGSAISNPFSLAGYQYTDKPTLYFNYWLQTEDVNSIVAMRDSARVYGSIDGGVTWQLLATNNSVPSIADTASYELPTFPSVSSKISTNSNQKVQQLYDSGSWRQARIDLGEFAGQSDIRLRFDFSTAGMFDSTQRDASGNLVNAFADNSNSFGRYDLPTRGQNNSFGGFHFDDVIVGFAERGEMVTGATGAAAEIGTFYNINTPTTQTVAPQSLFGSYQLDIRRGTEYGVQPDPARAAVQMAQLYDTNVRFVPTLDAPAVTIRGDGFEAVTKNLAVTLKAAGVDAVTAPNHGLIAGTPLVFSGLPAGSGLVEGNTYFVVNVKTNSFDVALTKGGGAITLLSAGAAAATAVTTPYTTVTFQASGTAAAAAVAQYTDVAPHAGTTFAPATGGRFAVLTGTDNTDRAQAMWDVSLTDATTLKTAAFLQYAFLNTAGRNSLPKTFSMATAADAPRGNGVAVSVDGGSLWTMIQDFAFTPYGDAVPEDGLPFGNGVPPTWKTAGLDLMAALASAGYAAGTVTTLNSKVVTVPSTASLVPGMAVAGADIPANTTILSIDSKTRITLSAVATATAAGKPLTFTPAGGAPAITLPGTVRIGFFQSGAGGFVALDDLQVLPAVPTPATGTIGDRDLIRQQGQFIIANNVVSDAQTYGISIDAGVRDQTSNVPHAGVPANLRNPNSGRLAPGAVVVNNIVAESGTAGIRFSGDANTTMPSAVPYGRIVNNTIFGGATFQAALATTNTSTAATVDPLFVPYLKTGMTVAGTGVAAGTTIAAINAATGVITLSAAATASGTGVTATFTSPNTAGTGVVVSDNAAPTLLNNVFARLNLGVSVDGTSRVDSASNLRTVIGANAYYLVNTQIGGTAGLFQNDAVTVTADPFVKSYAGNFYPAPASGGSPSIIDSSLNTLQDRNEYRAVVAPLGIPASPIIAPALDIYGQLRADDPTVASSPGLGANPFKDRGAVDRVDTKQPTASLSIPLDGSASDKAPATGVARIVGSDTAGVYRFVIQLADQGIGIDNTTVLPGWFTVKYVDRSGVVSDWANPPAGTTVQTLDSTTTNGYVFRYLENTKQVILESTATFAPGDYLVTVDNTRIADLAGLKLLNNDVNGTGTTAFKISLVDIPAAPTGLVLATAPAVDSGELTVSWNAPAYDGSASIVGYRLQTSTDNISWTTVSDANIVRANATATTATINGLTNGTPYFIRVAAVNSANGGTPADTTQVNWSAATGPIAPLSAPTLSLQTDSGTSADDGITNDPKVNVALDPGVTFWKYSLDGGTTWTVGSATSFNLPADATYAAGMLQARQSLLGYDGPLFTLSGPITLDTGVPARVVLASGQGVALAPAGGATATEAKQASGVVTVTGEAGVAIEVVFTGAGGGEYTANLLGDGSAQAVSLSDANLLTLGEGTVTVTASQTDAAGNRSPLPDVVSSFTLDTVSPVAPVVIPGTGVALAPAGGTTATEATDPTGVVTVMAEAGAAVAVTFTGVSGSVTKNVVGQGDTPVAIPLLDGDLATLGEGPVGVSAVATDIAGNPSPAGTNSFTLDTIVPAVPALVLGAGVGNLPDGGATSAKATQGSGVVTVKAEPGTTIDVVFYGLGGNVPKSILADGAVQAVVLTADDLLTLGEGPVNVTATASDIAGNVSDVGGPITFNLDVTLPTTAILELSADIDPTIAIRIPRAVDTAGIVSVTAETGATVTVTFTATVGVTTNTVTVPVTADGTAQPVALTRDQIDTLCTFSGSVQPDVAIDVSASVTDPAGNTSLPPDPLASFLLDAVAPPAPDVVLAAEADFATATEATALAGIVSVTAIAGNDVDVTFTGSAGTVTIPTFAATGLAQAIVLSAADLATLGDGPVDVSAIQTDPAVGNPSRSTIVTFTLDTVPPAAPDVRIGLGVLGGATAAEVAVGAVIVTGEDLAQIVVTFTGSAGVVTKPLTGTGTPQSITLSAGDIAALGQGPVNVSAVQTDPAGNTSPAGTTSFTLDSLPPAAPGVILGDGVGILPSGGATAGEATAIAGVVTVTAEAGSAVTITFTGTAGFVTKTVSGQGVTPVPVTLTADDLTTLGQGLVSVSAIATDIAGNTSPAGTGNFTLDTISPDMPIVLLGSGVGILPSGGATAAEMAVAAVTVTGEDLASIVVTFTGTLGSVTKTVTGQGSTPVAVTLHADEITTLGQGMVSVSAIATDVAGNASAAGTASFTLDSVAPVAPVVTLGSGVGILPSGGATAAEATALEGVVTVTAEAGTSVLVTFTGTAGSVLKSFTASGSAQPVVLPAGDLTTLGEGTVSVSAIATDIAGNASVAGTASFTLDTVVPVAPGVALGTNVGILPAGGATATEAAAGAVTVTGENLARIVVTFTGSSGTVTKTVTGQASAPVPVTLDAGDLTTLGQGLVNVSAIQTDVAGNTGSPDTASFTLDTVAPVAPIVTLGSGVGILPAGGATAAEATAPAGVVTVTAEAGTAVVVTFTGTAGVVTKSFTGSGVGQAVVLVDADLTSLGNGSVSVSAIATDVAGNASVAGTASFTLDTVAPVAPALALGVGVADGATATEATQAFGVVTITGEVGATIVVTFTGTAGIVTKTLTGSGAAQAVVLLAADLTTLGNGSVNVSAIQTDVAGNTGSPGTTSFTLDTVAPLAPVVALGAGVSSGATTAEATQASGVVTVTGEVGATIVVTFTGTVGTVAKTLTGSGAAQAVVLLTGDVTTLGNGSVNVSAIQTDVAGNTGSPGTTSFTLDTVAPLAPVVTLGTGVGILPSGGATAAEATAPAGVVTVTAEAGTAVVVTFSGTAGTLTKTLTASGSAQPVVLTAGNLLTLGQGTVSISAIATDTAGNESSAGTASLTLDTIAPVAPVVTLGTGVGILPSSGATAAEATQASGVVTVTGEVGSAIVVTFTGTAGTVTKTLTGSGTAQAVMLLAGDVTTLGNGNVSVSAIQTDIAGNTGAAGTTSFTLDTVAPLAPVLALGTGVGILPSSGATATEATQASGVVTVTGEVGATIVITFTGTAGTVTKTLTGSGAVQAVVLLAGDVTTLGDGAVSVSAVQTDVAGNTGAAGTTSFTLDTVAPTIVSFGSSTPDGTYGPDVTIAITATLSEAVRAGGAIAATLNTGAVVILTAATDGVTLTGDYLVRPGQTAADLNVVSYQLTSPIIDVAGSQMTSTALPGVQGQLATLKQIVVNGLVSATASSFSSDPARIADKRIGVRVIPIQFSTPVRGVSLKAFRLFYNGRSVSLVGAKLSGSGANYTLTLPVRATNLKGIYNLRILPGFGITAASNAAPMTQISQIFWGYGRSVGMAPTPRAIAFTTR